MHALRSMRFSPSHKRNFERMGPWLARPIAHRGLHNDHAGVIENAGLAFAEAIKNSYGVEADLRESADGVPMVFHDETLDRLTKAKGPVRAMTAAQLSHVDYIYEPDCIWTLDDLLSFTAGRTPLMLEVKHHRGMIAADFAARITKSLKLYSGPVAVMSFKPSVVAAFQALSPQTPRGLVAMRFVRNEWPELSALERFRRTHLLSYNAVRPHFVAYNWRDLPAVGPTFARNILKLPMFVWTVRGGDVSAPAVQSADNIIFESFDPDAWRQSP